MKRNKYEESNATNKSIVLNTIKNNKKALLIGLKKNKCFVSRACNYANLARKTFYEYYNKDIEFKEKVDDLVEAMKDNYEEKIYDRMEEGSDTMLIWYSKCKMKDRGYIDRQEVELGNADLSNLITIKLNNVKPE